MKDLRILVLSLVVAVVLTSCGSPGENVTGSEYMPDMAHSVAVEANTYNYYYYNTWDDRSTVELAKLVYPKYTVEGTVPRGYAGKYLAGGQAPATFEDAEGMRGSMVDNEHMNAISVPTNGFVPYYYDDTPEGRAAALADNSANPFPITEAGVIRGGNLYNIFCGVCHGAQGNGLGVIYDTDQNPAAKYPVAPANFLREEFLEANNERYYYAIMHGYNVMGAYKDKISYEERWQVIHYIRTLQAKETKTEYSEEANTFKAGVAQPLSKFDPVALRAIEQAELSTAAQLTDDAPAGGAAGGQTLRKK